MVSPDEPVVNFLEKLSPIRQSRLRWPVAVLAFVMAFAVRYVLQHQLPPGFPFLTFFPAVILSAFLCGTLPGIFVATASTLASWYFFISPLNSFGLNGAVALALGFFIAVASIDIAIIHYLIKWMEHLDRERQRSRELAAARDLLFREMQHRISNNLSVISALLRLQQRALKDEAAKRALSDAAMRLSLISKIQRQLHDPQGQELAFGTSLQELCQDIVEASGTRQRISVRVEAPPLFLGAERAVPLGLIIAELVANALEHAFEGREEGRITITLAETPEGLAIRVADDGHGVPEGFDLTQAKSLGLTVARQLAQQLGGELVLASGAGEGARFELVLGEG
ncbi:hypothetical protein BTR14_07090 [Rhizobium rhizosphaerae]|uniref:histidine kinase n=1 Tax=Xaviernesmea rhizosphaerae TaxID=1672749 RepID=A0ABX3PGB8_9HYPH|nr:histidine kinase dimerization/phosphoacceptor domain -containing protein [Xaviernesmea rhizosphaerae]OQP87181.1 hypothetical protein BTR14_07090 [Xaviernesmea rhizosphaerae]